LVRRGAARRGAARPEKNTDYIVITFLFFGSPPGAFFPCVNTGEKKAPGGEPKNKKNDYIVISFFGRAALRRPAPRRPAPRRGEPTLITM
jgi:hypothetical protein